MALDASELKNLANRLGKPDLKKVFEESLYESANIPLRASKSASWFKRVRNPILAKTTRLIKRGLTAILLVPTRGVGSVPYAKYVWFGTGIYGPKKQVIKPKNAKALAFKVGGRTIFRKSVRGQEANPWVEKAERKTRKEWVSHYIKGVAEGLKRLI